MSAIAFSVLKYDTQQSNIDDDSWCNENSPNWIHSNISNWDWNTQCSSDAIGVLLQYYCPTKCHENGVGDGIQGIETCTPRASV